ncbi:ribulose 1,5-bisphosphate carboxylase large subunit [Actinomycetes bacterium M1A6_2h]
MSTVPFPRSPQPVPSAPAPRRITLTVPTPADVVGLVRGTVLWSLDTVALVASLPTRIDGLFAQLDALLAKVEAITESAAAVIVDVEHTTTDAKTVVTGASEASTVAQRLIGELEPIADRGLPLGRKFVENFSDAELDAAIKMVDQLPELMTRMEALMPILETMDSVAPELHQLLEVTTDVRRAVIGIPGFKFFRNRGQDKLDDDQV